MALDYGDVRIGISLSDLLKTIASPYETYKRKNLEEDINYFINLTKEKEVTKIIIGLPLNMDGSAGERVNKTKEFGKLLAKKTGLEIEYVDERLTSVEAEEILIKSKVRRDKRKVLIDKIAASLILESYLNR